MVTPSNAATACRESSVTPDNADTAQQARKSLVMRKYRISSLREDGSVRVSEQIGPAMPCFEAAFSAFAHGTLIATDRGQVPIEDLEPGLKVDCADHGPLPIVWIGAMTMMPRSDHLPDSGTLTRITADSYGFGRPQSDIMAGPGARFLQRTRGLSGLGGREQMLTPVANMVDGVNAIEITPRQPLTVYHICLERHAVISAGGLETESFHPGTGFERSMGPRMLALFLSFFPHIREPVDFGPLSRHRLPFEQADTAAEVA